MPMPWRSIRNMRNRMAHGYLHQPRCGAGDGTGIAGLQQLPAVRQVPTMKT
jgi:hypothetical protein